MLEWSDPRDLARNVELELAIRRGVVRTIRNPSNLYRSLSLRLLRIVLLALAGGFATCLAILLLAARGAGQ